MPGFRQRMTQRRDDQPAHEAGVAEPDLGLGRVHVHVHHHRVTVDEQRRRRVPVAGEHVGIGRPQGTDQQLVAHRAAVDEQVLRHRRPARIGRQGRQPAQVNPVAHRVDPERVVHEIAPHDPAKPPVQRPPEIPAFRVRAQHHPPVTAARQVAQGEAHEGLRHRQPLDHIGDRLRLRPVGAQELQPRGRRVKEIAEFDHRACAQCCRAHRALSSAGHRDAGRIAPRVAARQGQPPHRPERGQRLPPEAEAVDVQQVRPVDLGRGMPGERGRQVRRRDAMPVSGDAQQGATAVGKGDLDPPRACVERVLHQFLDRRCGPLHDLARRDPVDRRFGKLRNPWGVLCYVGVW